MSNRYEDDDAFDADMRRALSDLPVPEGELAHLPRRDFLRAGMAAAGLATLAAAGWAGLAYETTPTLVRLAFAHANEESGLRGLLVPDMAGVRLALGKPLPGVLQLCKDCVVDGYAAWHLNSYLDNLGYVHVFAFRGAVPALTGQGHWLGGYWHFLAGAHGAPILVLSRHLAAVDAVVRQLQA
jgi:hypothetical protein